MAKQGDLVHSSQDLMVTAITNPFGIDHEQVVIGAGDTIAEILLEVCPDLVRYKPLVFLGDVVIYPEYYHVVRPKPGHIISIRMSVHGDGGGKKNPLRTILTIAVAVAAAWAAPALAGAAGFTAGTGAFAGASALIGGTLTAIGGLVVNAIAPIAQPSRGGAARAERVNDETNTYFIQGARNRLDPLGSVPELLGTYRMTPKLATKNFTEVSGDVVFARQMFLLTNGKLLVEAEKLGDTLLTEYEEYEEENFFDANSHEPSTIVPAIVTDDALNIELEDDEWSITQTSAVETDELEVQITFPQGLIVYDDEGERLPGEGAHRIRYAPTGTEDWVEEIYPYTRTTNAGFVVARRFKGLVRGQYDVQVKRKQPKSTSARASDTMRWSSLRSYKNENPVRADDVSLKALRIKGTKQLNGPVDDYNLIGTRLFPDWDGSAWVEDQPTSNPASIYRYVLLSEFAKTPLTLLDIDSKAFEAWHDFCAAKGLTYDSYIDYDMDREELLNEIAAAGLAAPALNDNKYSVVVDNDRELIAQQITQRNSFNYSYEKSFLNPPHALRVPFNNRDKDYLPDELVVYADGYDQYTATNFDRLSFPGVTSEEANYRLARHRLAEMVLRPDMHKVSMDIEHLIAKKGDRVKFSHDVALIGLASGRIKRVILNDEETHAVGIEVDEVLTVEVGKNYAVEIRTLGGQLSASVGAVAGEVSVLNFSAPIPLAAAPSVHDLFSFGETDSVVLDAKIHSVIPQAGELAEVLLVDYAPDIFAASAGTLPQRNQIISTPVEFTRPKAPKLIQVQSDELVQVKNIDGSISSRMIITLENVNAGFVQALCYIRPIGDSEYVIASTVELSENRVVIEGLNEGSLYDIEIYYRRLGAELSSSQISPPLRLNGVTFVGEGARPPDVQNFNITVRGQTAHLSWDPVQVIDLKGYQVRFTADTSSPQWNNAVPLQNILGRDVNSLSTPGAVGSYLIKAYDLGGRDSENAAVVLTTVGVLDGVDVVGTIDEHLSWAGTHTNTVKVGNALRLSSGLTSGVYNFAQIFDMGQVYKAVISADLSVAGVEFGEFMDVGGLIDSLGVWDGDEPDDYNVTLQVRFTDDDPTGSPLWSEWRTIEMAEYTARAFEFRYLLESYHADVTPSVERSTININMPDRVQSGHDITVGVAGLRVDFASPFWATPALAVSVDDMLSEDRYTLSSQDEYGFNVQFFNGAGDPVERTFSYVAKGFGQRL